MDEEHLRTIGALERGERRADEALPCAALATGAALVAPVTNEDRQDTTVQLADGIGALLRHR